MKTLTRWTIEMSRLEVATLMQQKAVLDGLAPDTKLEWELTLNKNVFTLVLELGLHSAVEEFQE